jgi:hypothetical protein
MNSIGLFLGEISEIGGSFSPRNARKGDERHEICLHQEQYEQFNVIASERSWRAKQSVRVGSETATPHKKRVARNEIMLRVLPKQKDTQYNHNYSCYFGGVSVFSWSGISPQRHEGH